jgi:hypothetical protein
VEKAMARFHAADIAEVRTDAEDHGSAFQNPPERESVSQQ